MEWWQAVLLGIVEGVTEYLPISSTGHLILAQRAMGMASSTQANAYAICIQAGAIVAVLGLYWRHVRQMGLGVLGRDERGARMADNLVVGVVPAGVVGVLFEDQIDRYLFGLWPVVAAWFVGGVAILVVARWRRQRSDKAGSGYALHDLTWQMAMVIGLAQCLALWPGTSRSLVTIMGGVLVGMSLPAAVEFSFLLGVVTLGGATVLKARHHGPLMIESYGWAPLVIGFVLSLVSAVGAVKWMVGYLNRNGLRAFGYYRVALAAVVAGLIVSGLLTVPTGP
jgi:undecaprenyl-diphosphatase